MNWIEKLMGISPDGGNGVTELTLALALALVLAAAMAAATRRRARASRLQ